MNKKVRKFVAFDIKGFYSSFKKELLKEALDFASSYVNIPEIEKNLINHARKSLLFDKQETWIKKESGLFDVTMGAYDWKEECDLLGYFLLYTLSLKYNKTDIGLYRDDGLAVFRIIVARIVRKLKMNLKSFLLSMA